MKILLIGGTRFLGRHIVEAAVSRGHEVTLFHRGRHSVPEFSKLETIRGDRDADLSGLRGRTWNAAVDTCGYFPKQVAATAGLLANFIEHYTFISSLSVYKDGGAPGRDESAETGTIADAAAQKEITGENYGPLKVLCEQAAEAAMPGRVLNVRSGLIVGPFDPTDRFTYWVDRFARGGEVLAPAGADYRVQLIDARDLSEWIVSAIERSIDGVFNATGPVGKPLTLGAIADACTAAAKSDAKPLWVSEQFLLGNNVAPWSDLPLWIPEKESAGFHTFSVAKAAAAGLKTRPIADTVAATLGWLRSRTATPMRAGLKPERERELLGLLKGR